LKNVLSPALRLFDVIDIRRVEDSAGPARSFEDYVVNVNDNDLGEVNLIRKIG
jgi:CRISPR-associated protein Csd2